MTTSFRKIICDKLVVHASTTIPVGTIIHESKTLTDSDSGKTFSVSADENLIILPLPISGRSIKLLFQANTNPILIVTAEFANSLSGSVLQYLSQNIVSQNVTNNGGSSRFVLYYPSAGSWIEFICIVSGMWMVTGVIYSESDNTAFDTITIPLIF